MHYPVSETSLEAESRFSYGLDSTSSIFLKYSWFNTSEIENLLIGFFYNIPNKRLRSTSFRFLYLSESLLI